MEDDFREDLEMINTRLREAVESGFANYDYIVLDFKVLEKPKKIRPELELFWGGYYLEFILIPKKLFEQLGGDIEKARRNAPALTPENSTKLRWTSASLSLSANTGC